MFDRIVLVGAGRTSGSIIERLARLAPVTIVDLSQAALDILASRALPPTSNGEPSDAQHPILKRTGDGTSRLVLADLRGDPKSLVGLVVAPGDDRAALECCRLAAELDYKPIICVVNDRDVALECEKHGAHPLVRVELVGQLVEQTLQRGGLGVTSAAGGFGRGEIFELTVMPSSPAIGIPLARLRADGWRVAAIYRGSELVLPTGTTMIAADDRVLIVGDPKQLPHVAESLRVGLPTFPLLHGPNVVVYLPNGRDESIEAEAELLTMRTRAARMVRAFPGANAARRVIETPMADGRTGRKRFDEVGIEEGASTDRHILMLRSKNPGVVVTRAHSRTLLERLVGTAGPAAELCNEMSAPVLFSRGPAEYERIVLCVTDGLATNNEAGEVALDLARMFEAPFRIVRVKLPSYLQEAASATDMFVEAIANRARLHGLKPEVEVIEGNPIREWLRVSKPTDLTIIARSKSNRDSFSAPDLALHVARKSKGSVLVLTSDAA